MRINRSRFRLEDFPCSGRIILEFPELPYREIVLPPHRFFYRVIADIVISLLQHLSAFAEDKENSKLRMFQALFTRDAIGGGPRGGAPLVMGLGCVRWRMMKTFFLSWALFAQLLRQIACPSVVMGKRCLIVTQMYKEGNDAIEPNSSKSNKYRLL